MKFSQYLTTEAKKSHDDTEEDKALIKKMVKPEALKEEELDEVDLKTLQSYSAKKHQQVSALKSKAGWDQMAATRAKKTAGSTTAKLAQDKADASAATHGAEKAKLDQAHRKINQQRPAKVLDIGSSATHISAEYDKSSGGKRNLGDSVELKDQDMDTVVENSPFDWKNKKSEIDWAGDKEKSAEGGTIHKARTKARNAEGGELEKKGRGRPKGEYGSYKIDKSKRDDPEYKKQLSQKVMAAKAENFKVRKEFKDSMNDAIKKHQLKLAGLDK